MAKECNNTSCDKASCEGCSSSKKQQNFQAEMNAQSNVKHVIGVVSGKGGVGKSFVTGSLANKIIFLEAGIPEENISMPNLCTCCNPEFLFSHRASHGKRGNLGAFLGIRS